MATLRRWSLTLVTAVVTAAVLLAAGLLAFGGTSDRGAQAAPSPLAGVTPQASQQTSNIGPEGVPVSGGKPLGPARSPGPGKSSGGIICGASEQLTYHVHARLTLFVHGKPRAVPLGVGVGAPVQKTNTANGPFASDGRCFSFLHTHAADGIIHIEAPGKVTFKLGQFFDVWQQRLDSRHLGSVRGHLVAYVNGKRYRGNPRAIPLVKHAQIQLQVGKPLVAPARISFPQGL